MVVADVELEPQVAEVSAEQWRPTVPRSICLEAGGLAFGCAICSDFESCVRRLSTETNATALLVGQGETAQDLPGGGLDGSNEGLPETNTTIEVNQVSIELSTSTLGDSASTMSGGGESSALVHKAETVKSKPKGEVTVIVQGTNRDKGNSNVPDTRSGNHETVPTINYFEELMDDSVDVVLAQALRPKNVPEAELFKPEASSVSLNLADLVTDTAPIYLDLAPAAEKQPIVSLNQVVLEPVEKPTKRPIEASRTIAPKTSNIQIEIKKVDILRPIGELKIKRDDAQTDESSELAEDNFESKNVQIDEAEVETFDEHPQSELEDAVIDTETVFLDEEIEAEIDDLPADNFSQNIEELEKYLTKIEINETDIVGTRDYIALLDGDDDIDPEARLSAIRQNLKNKFRIIRMLAIRAILA